VGPRTCPDVLTTLSPAEKRTTIPRSLSL